ncbi:hypothetical protein D3C74_338920 [compost metagenome]
MFYEIKLHKINYPLRSLFFTTLQGVRILEESALIVNDFSHTSNCNPLIAVMQLQGGKKMDVHAQARDPREHVNEEPRNDLGDLLAGFFGMTGFMTVVFFGMVIIKFLSE